MAKMTDESLLGVLQHELESAVSWSQTHLSEDQLKNLQYYLGMPLGNEIKGRSQVVSWDVFEIVESAMPGLIEPFFSSDEIGKFEPRGPEDEAYSDQATDYINYLIKQRNAGFLIFNTWIKDGLMSKVGVVRGEWEKAQPKRRAYTGLTDQQMNLLSQDNRVKIIEHSAYALPGWSPQPMNEAQSIQMTGQTQPKAPQLHDVTVLQAQAGCVKIENVRPENFVLTNGIGSIDKARIIGEWVVYTRSELRQMGFKQAADVTSYDLASAVLDGETIQSVREESAIARSLLQDNSDDETLEEVRLFKGYIRADVNGDGIAEWRRILVGGGEDSLLENEEAETHNYAVWSPILIPHRVIGMAYADAGRPIHEIKTVLTRQYLDSLYLANRPRTYVNLDAKVSMDDVLSDRIGGIVRGSGPPQNAIQPLTTTLVSREALEGLQLADGMRETRLGIPKYNPGLEPDALHKTATGVRSVNNLVDKRQKMTLRIFAETGVKDLFKLVLGLTVEYQDVAAVVRLRGKFAEFDPRGWNADLDVVVDVGVGTSDEEQTLMMLQQFGQYMAYAAPYGVVQPRNVYEFGKMLAKNARIKGAEERLLTDPTTVQQQPPQPSPDVVFKAQHDAQKFRAETERMQQEREFQAKLQWLTDQNRQEMEARQKQLEMQQQGALVQLQEAHKRELEELKLVFQVWQTEFQARVQLAPEALSAAYTYEPPPPPLDLAPLIEHLQAISAHIQAPPAFERDGGGEVVAVHKNGRRYLPQKDANGRIVGLSPDGAH